jgi:hypothetical protein
VAHLRRGARETELHRTESILTTIGPRRADAAIALAIFSLSSIVGGVYVAHFVRSGNHPFFYQSYFEPAVMTACGRGFLVSPAPPPPALDAFLHERTDRFSCDELPRDLKVGTAGLYQRPWRYLLTTVAIAWMVLGISWSGLVPLFGVLFGATTALVYVLSRLIVGRVAAAACAAALCLSPVQLENLPNLRDYAKAPCTVALVAILIALVVRRWRTRDVLLLSLSYGLVMGVGYGFRTDVLVDIPPFLITVALFLPDGVLRHVPVKIGSIALCTAGFVAAGWPIISSVTSGGGCQWHFSLLGLTSPFDDALGVTGGAYGFGHLFKDEYLWATISSYANRMRPDLGYIEYCSHEYDVASGEYLRRIVMMFPADIVTRAYASTLHVLAVPLHRVPALSVVGPLLAALFVLVTSSISIRLALFAVFAMLYFGGYPAIQFLPRHYFPFEIITVVIVAFLIERGVQVLRERRAWAVSPPAARRMAMTAAIVAVMLSVPLVVLRAYQNRGATRLLESYLDAPTSDVPLKAIGAGSYEVVGQRHGPPPSEIEAVGALGRAGTRFIELEFAATCRPATRVTFRYDPTYPPTDLSHAIELRAGGTLAGPTRIFEPVYPGFQRIDVSDPSPACSVHVSAVNGADRFALLLPAQLPPGWSAQPQYQRIAHLR